MGLIYKVTNLITNEIYIGQTRVSLNRRKSDHLCRSKLDHNNTHFYNALRKYGLENFEWSIIEDNIDPIFLNQKEKYWIEKFDTYNHGYNATTGGKQGMEVRQETKEKLRQANLGKKHSKKTKEKMKKAHKGKDYLKNRKGSKLTYEQIKHRTEKQALFWEIINPKEEISIIQNLTKFCKENNLCKTSMLYVAYGKLKFYKGWKCKKLGKIIK